MKRFLSLIVFALAFSAFADADSYLLWMVGDNDGNVPTLDGKDLPSTGKYSAGVFTVDSNGNRSDYLMLYTADEHMTEIGQTITITDFTESPFSYADLGSSLPPATVSYYVELLQDGDVIGHSSEGLSYNALVDYIYSGVYNPSLTTWQITSFTTAAIIPEPNSAMLMIFGFAALALRRRKMSAKAA